MKIKTEYIILVFILVFTTFIITQKPIIDGFTSGRPPPRPVSQSNNNNKGKSSGGGGGSACMIM